MGQLHIRKMSRASEFKKHMLGAEQDDISKLLLIIQDIPRTSHFVALVLKGKVRSIS